MKSIDKKSEWQIIRTTYDETYWKIIGKFAQSALLEPDKTEDIMADIELVTRLHKEGMTALKRLVDNLPSP